MPKKQHSPEELKRLREQHLKEFAESLEKSKKNHPETPTPD